MRGPLALPGLAEKGVLLGADYSSPLTARQDFTDSNSTPPVAEKEYYREHAHLGSVWRPPGEPGRGKYLSVGYSLMRSEPTLLV